ncbi:MAG: hypothetical protein KatS3mg102_1593 [Planctomycetota bacterium]|nr:MAG: hypothetical protein KatS3mg102_1593 [Planctomycetota bacterium]
MALRVAGPSAIVAFGLNGLLALLTAFSFAELATAFPEAGGAYVYAKKVFPIGGGFAAGWVLWFAYAVACALYALGFGGFFAYGLEQASGWLGRPLAAPPWLPVLAAVLVAVLYAALLCTRGARAGNLVSLLKVVVFAALIASGLVALWARPAGTLAQAFTPLFPFGFGGTLAAMGFTFIALEGFEVVTTVSHEVRAPTRTIPRAMFLSIGITLLVYLGLLFVMLTAGGPPAGGEAWRELGEHGEAAVAVAARRASPVRSARGFVTAAGLLATFTALGAAMLGGSRVAYAMGCDRALPRGLARLQGRSGNPVRAVLLTAADRDRGSQPPPARSRPRAPPPR